MTLRYTFRTEPYPHQLRALAKIAKVDGKAGLFLPMRTGKTKTAIDWAGIGYYNHGVRRVLIVCPISVIDVWASEIEKHCSVPEGAVQVDTLRDTAVENGESVQYWIKHLDPDDYVLHFVIVNYEMVWRNATKSKRLDAFIAEWQPDLVIADEAHKLKNPQSQQSKALMRLGKAARMKLALTGTPIAKAPLDVYGIFRFVDPDVFGMTWPEFKERYAVWEPARYEPRVKVVKAWQNLPELVGKVKAHSFRMKLTDAFPGIPPVTFTNIKTPLGPSARKVYDDMAKEMIAEIGDGRYATAKIVLEKAIRLRQVASGFIKDENGIEVDLDDTKLNMLMDLIDSTTAQDEKLVIFCSFIHDYRYIGTMLHTRGISYRSLTGSETDKQKSEAKHDFQTLPSVPVIVCQVQSGSLGIDLSAARLTAFYNLTYNWVEYKQALDRTLNVRDNRPRGAYHLLAPATIDVTMLNVLGKRGDLAENLLTNPRSVLDEQWPES